MLQGFARLMLGQLRLPAKSYAFGHGASAAFVSPLQDQAALKFSDAGQHGQHETAMRSRSVGPRIAERLEASAFLADQVDDPQQVERRARQPVELGHDQDVASLKLIERALQFRPVGGNAGHLLAEYPLNACGQEQRLLRRQRLPGRGDAGVSIDCHFAPDIYTKIMPDITISAIWCATCKLCNRRRGISAVCCPGTPSEA